jgi:hypothetical protein
VGPFHTRALLQPTPDSIVLLTHPDCVWCDLQMFLTKKAPWPVERTLLVTGALDALMTSHAEGSQRMGALHLCAAHT